MSARKHKVGVIGTGRIGRIHVENLLHMPNVSLRVVADPRAADAAAWARKIGLSGLSEDPEEVLENSSIEAVFICSPTETHATYIRQAAARGLHIFCEKPIDLEVEEARSAVQAAAREGVRLQIGFNRRFDRNFRRMRESVLSGQVGEPHLIRITSRDPEPPPPQYVESSGGIFRDMTIHDFDMARYLSGREVESVFATGSCLVDPAIGQLGDVDTAVTVLTFSGGLTATIDNSRRAVYGYDQRAEVFGSAGAVETENERPSSVRWMTANTTESERPLWFFLQRYTDAYRSEVEAFLRALEEEIEVPVTGHDGVEALRIATAATMSLGEGRIVRMNEL